ncbi:MAG: peptidylprolyl isomerase [Flavobacteriaceae bacterium]
MKKMTNLLFGALALLFSCTDSKPSADDGIYADIKTSKGTITVKLEYEKTPVTVANFISLAEGTNPFVKEQYKGKKYYDGLKFHRVIADFMVQGGCPEGTGKGEPGYKFIDEITDLKHHRAGTLSMANSGPKTNGSQFFITHKDTPWLDGKHTVFGYVTQGQDIVDKIAQNDVIESVTIIRKGKNAKKFDAAKVFSDHFKAEAEAQEKAEAQTRKVKEQKKAFFEMNRAKATKTKSGLEFVVIEQGSKIKPTQDQEILVEYSGFLEDGTLFDTSIEQVAREFGIYNPQRPYQPFPYTLSNKIGVIPGFLEGLEQLNINDKAVLYIPSHLGYGEKGAGSFIPPNANLIFEVKISEKK